MKRAFFLLLFLPLLPALLAGCGREAKEPAPGWPERLIGEYDATVTFTFRGAEPAAVGVDSQTGKMTALFNADSGYLALGWRRVLRGEAEIMESFLAETGAETGVWAPDADVPGAVESYVRLGRSWYCLSAACDDLEEAALLNLVDGTVEAAAEADSARPRADADR